MTEYAYVIEDSGIEYVTLVAAFTDYEQAQVWVQEFEPRARLVRVRFNPMGKVLDEERIDIH